MSKTMHARTCMRGARMRCAQLAFASLIAIAGCSSSDVGERVGTNAAAVVLPNTVSLDGSNFEIDPDANLTVENPAPALDWANVNEIRKQDTLSVKDDESFGQGTKEDTAEPTVVTGGIPPNKSDLKFFGLYQEGNTSTGFLNMFWTRVQEPQGTTNMDFELNKRQCTPNQTPADPDCSSNGLTPLRSVGDLLITYDLAQGGTHPVLSLRTWNGSVWGSSVDLTTSGKATGAINTSPITDANSDGLGALSARTFGEAQIAMSALFGSGTCTSFGSVYLKSRSSDSFTAALKDFVPPQAINITNCGQIVMRKVTVPSPDPTDSSFGYATTGGLTPASFSLKNNGSQSYSNVQSGLYSVTESAPGPLFALTGLDCSASSLTNGSTVTTNTATRTVSIDLKALDRVDCTFTNSLQQGAIRIHKTTSKDGGDLAGAQFDVRKASDNSLVAHVTTGSNGVACVGLLLFGDYKVTETAPPSGYQIDDPTTHTVTVDNAATCGSGNEETIEFSDTPLSRITVAFESLAAGNPTSATISCTGPNVSVNNAPLPEGTPRVLDSLVPGSYSCTVVVDP